MNNESNDAAGVKLVSLGFVAVIAIAGLVMLFTQVDAFGKPDITGNVAGMNKFGTNTLIQRTPYEACRAVRPTDPSSPRYVWSGDTIPGEDYREDLIMCVDPKDPHNPYKYHWVSLQLKYG